MRTLYIVHGWAYSVSPWEETIAELKKAGIEAKMLHVPGLTAPSGKIWTIEDYVEWLHGHIKNVKDPVVLGHSNGGRILLNYDIAHPTKLKHMILLNSAGVLESPKSIALKRKVLRVGAKLVKPLKHIPPVRKAIYKFIGASDYEKAPPNMKKTLQNMLSSDANLDVQLCKTEASLLWGAKDVMTPLAQGRMLYNLLPHASLQIFDEWRHAPYKTHPKQLAEAITSILKEVES